MKETRPLTLNVTYKAEQQYKKHSYFNSDYLERTVPLPKELAEGEVQTIQILKGLGTLNAKSKIHKERFITGTDAPYNIFKFPFVLFNTSAAEIIGTKKKIMLMTGETYILSPSVEFNHDFYPSDRFHFFCILVEPSLLYPFIEEFGSLIPPDYCKLLEDPSGDPFYHRGRITPAMNLVLQQIQHCPYRGSLKRMYLEGKALELIVLRLEQLIADKKSIMPTPPLSPGDIDRVHHAREILVNKLKDPPSLSELARLVALNRTKLTKGFRGLFGTTVFAYLRGLRLERARLFLEEGKMRVNQVAHEVGYHSLSHFCLAFKRRFGFCPSIYLKGTRLE